jgi:hypothetical protein
MGRESREVWQKRVERWRDSGLPAEQFAAEVGINAGNLRQWSYRLNAERRRAEEKRSPMEAEALTWVEVSAATPYAATTTKPVPPPEPTVPPAAPTEKLELVLASGMTVRVPAHFEPAALRRLLTVVG